jgi:hypothetical protein
LVSWTVTGSDGSFAFSDSTVPIGDSYRVCFPNPPPGLVFAPQHPATDPGTVSTVDPITGCAPCFIFQYEYDNTLNNAGLCVGSGPPPVCPPATSCIGSDFNGTSMAQGNYIWLNSIVKVNGRGSNPATIMFNNSVVSFSVNGLPITLSVPPSTIKFDNTAASATTTYNAGLSAWVTTVPVNYSGNVFLSGVAYKLPSKYPGGIKPVTWCGDFTADTGGLSVQWQWGAAVYTTLCADLITTCVKPIDGNKQNPYTNSDHAGTPECFKKYVTGGARGGGGSNFTGSYSATKSATLCP